MSTDPYSGPPPESYHSDPGYAAAPGYGGYGPSGPLPDRSEAASKKLAAGLCGVVLGVLGLGGLGAHKFILGYTNAGAIMLAVTIATLVGGFPTCGLTWPATAVMSVIGLIEGIIYLTKSDEEFYQTYMVGKKEWF
jgi:TM2 domain-containing membrane protein YozV